jgi:hypothetical protein
MTLTEKLLARASGKARVAAGDNIWVNTDVLMTHDVCGPGTIGVFRREFGKAAKVWDRERLVIIPDHYILTADSGSNRNVDLLREFAWEQELRISTTSSTIKRRLEIRPQGVEATIRQPIRRGLPRRCPRRATHSKSCSGRTQPCMGARSMSSRRGSAILTPDRDGNGKLLLKAPETMYHLEGRLQPASWPRTSSCM